MRTDAHNDDPVVLARFPALRALAWQLDIATLTRAEALALYERNWRHVDTAALTDAERSLIDELTRDSGGRLLV